MNRPKARTVPGVLALVLTVLCLAGCAQTGTADPPPLSPESIAEQLYTGVEVPPYEIVKLDETSFERYSFIPYEDGITAASADALVSITPHSMVVMYLPDGSGAEKARQVCMNADPNKWLCVGSETVIVTYTDHYVVLIMSDRSTASAITDNFREMAAELDGMEPDLMTKDNSRYEP